MHTRSNNQGWGVLALLSGTLLGGCGDDGSSAEGTTGGDDTGSTDDAADSSGESGAPMGDCAVDPELTPCGEGQLCLGGACTPLTPCAGDDCATGPSFALPDTNLRECYGASPDGADGTIACPGEAGGEACGTTDYCGGDAQYGWDALNPANARFSTQPGDEPVVVDAVTGLSWQGCVLGQAGAGCSGTPERVDWYAAQTFCTDATWGGFDDWVLPSSHALQSITDYGTTSPAIDRSVFVNAPSGFAEDPDQWWIECQWSSTDWAGDPEVAWALMTNNGDVSSGSGLEYHHHDKAAEGWEGCYARCVRDPGVRSWERFVRAEPMAGEPIVADTATGLVWHGCSEGQSGSDCGAGSAAMIDWRAALAACESSTWGGHSDWRLPNVKELRSIVDERVQLPAVDPVAFPNTPYYGVDGDVTMNIGQFWSSTARSYNSFALYVDLGFGFSHFYVQDEGRHVRCVR